MENPLPVAGDLPIMPNRHIQTKFDSKIPQNDAINANSANPADDGDVKGYEYDRSDSQRKDIIIPPHSLLPKPEAPPGLLDRSLSLPETFDSPASAIGKFLREKSNSVSAAFKRISSLTTDDDDDDDDDVGVLVKEFNLVGLKVVKTLKGETKELKGRISFFSRSNCRDSTAVRLFLRERNLSFVEINIDVYRGREKELRERTGAASVPQIFFNEKKCPDDAPAPPVYGFDEEGDVVVMDEMAEIVRIVRQRVPIQDRITKMKFVKNCFSGAELVEELIHHLDCGRKKAVEIGKQLARRHFIHHVFGDNEFEDGNHFYRFLEHEPFIPKCYNFRGVVNDSEPKDAAAVSRRLTCIMSAILESYASDDRLHLDYIGISNSEEFRRYVNLVEDLQRVNLLSLSDDEKLAFFLNLHNSMAIHAVIRIGHPGGMIDRGAFFSDFMYVIGGHPYSLSSIKNGILRSNRRPPYSLIKPFSNGDKRLELAFEKVNRLIHFGIWNATRASPSIRFFKSQGIESELRNAAREYFQRDDGMQVDLAKRTVYLPRILKWYSADFGQEKEIPEWMIKHLDASKAGLLTHLMSDGGSVNIAYQDYDWSLNS
ncbi:glutaredoxin-like protein [Perilla frutescens var. frutescens]|nr:glutaredoxin-like protein [Perilla frutescens var. frutescens]